MHEGWAHPGPALSLKGGGAEPKEGHEGVFAMFDLHVASRNAVTSPAPLLESKVG